MSNKEIERKQKTKFTVPNNYDIWEKTRTTDQCLLAGFINPFKRLQAQYCHMVSRDTSAQNPDFTDNHDVSDFLFFANYDSA